MSIEAKLEAVSAEFQKVQKDLSNAIENRQRLDSQLQENMIVHKEFKNLKNDANIYKLIGPVLVKQSCEEATSNVDKRLEYINAEIKRVEGVISDLSQKSETMKDEIVRLQANYQAKLQELAAATS